MQDSLVNGTFLETGALTPEAGDPLEVRVRTKAYPKFERKKRQNDDAAALLQALLDFLPGAKV